SKRRLRSRLERTDLKRPTIAKNDFEECMDQLLAAQIAVEEIQDLIATRRDLIKETDRQRAWLLWSRYRKTHRW
ncbi:MAG: hypothetical protein AAB318_01680, partial [Planctomycetota bacterium]